MWMLLVGLGWAAETEGPPDAGSGSAPLLRVGLGVGFGGALPSTRFRLELVSARPIPVGSLRLIVGERLIIEPSFSHAQTLERGTQRQGEAELEEELAYSETQWGLALKPVLFQRKASWVYPFLAYGREQVLIQGQDYVEGDESLQAFSDLDLVHAAHLGFGIQRWLDEDWSVSVDASLVNVGVYEHEWSEERDSRSEQSSGTFWAVSPSAKMMLHLYW